MFTKITKIVTKIKQEKPLILNITNDVTMDFVANGLLSLGASPVMSNAEQEVEELVKLAACVVINLGTLNKAFNHLCEQTCIAANRFNKPIILDPVGAGASKYRTETSLHFLKEFQIAIVRGNASEIMALTNLSALTKGVDSTMESADAVQGAKLLSAYYNTVVVISGKTDVIVENEIAEEFTYGSPLMPLVTGTGCLLSSLVAAFHSVEKNRFDAAAAAAVFYGVCGEIAAKKSTGPGSFKMNFLDALHEIPEQNYDEKK
ncbi:MAG: hydroxyethylthiazole kinase [Gammaproteobacteria bacterium]